LNAILQSIDKTIEHLETLPSSKQKSSGCYELINLTESDTITDEEYSQSTEYDHVECKNKNQITSGTLIQSEVIDEDGNVSKNIVGPINNNCPPNHVDEYNNHETNVPLNE
jgi:hypothetical protein